MLFFNEVGCVEEVTLSNFYVDVVLMEVLLGLFDLVMIIIIYIMIVIFDSIVLMFCSYILS